MATQTEQQRKAAARKAAATRRRNAARQSARRTQASARATQTQAQRTAGFGPDYALDRLNSVVEQAQRAVLIPVGAALVARDNVVDATRPYTTRQSAERELTRLQRRVTTNLRK